MCSSFFALSNSLLDFRNSFLTKHGDPGWQYSLFDIDLKYVPVEGMTGMLGCGFAQGFNIAYFVDHT